jgi:hypothetical protein
VGDEDDPSNVVIELIGTLTWSSPFGRIEGVTFRRPKISLDAAYGKPLIKIAADAKLDLYNCIVESNAVVHDAVDSVVMDSS